VRVSASQGDPRAGEAVAEAKDIIGVAMRGKRHHDEGAQGDE
jgi:hypothetical protein